MPQNFKINITFSTPFKLENEANCSYDSLKIYDGETANPLAILGQRYGYCGSNIPPSVISSGNSLLILFESDGNNAFYGFNLTYTKGKLKFFWHFAASIIRCRCKITSILVDDFYLFLDRINTIL